MTRQDRISALKAAAKERILILDGSWGVMIQRRGLEEADYRGDRFRTIQKGIIAEKVQKFGFPPRCSEAAFCA